MAITAEELNIILQVRDDKFSKQIDRATSKVTGFSRNVTRRAGETTRAFNRMGNSARQNRAAFQNASFQLQDIFVQLSMGTSVTRTLSQQLPQLLGGFGALGAGVGVGVAALGMFAPALFDSVDAAEEAEDSIKALTDSIAALKAAEANFSTSNSDLLDTYGALSDKARDLLAIQKQVAAFRAESALAATTRSLAGSVDMEGVLGVNPSDIRDASNALDVLRAKLDELNSANQLSAEQFNAAAEEVAKLEPHEATLSALVKNFDNLAETLGITKLEAQEVSARFAEVGQADGPRAQAAAMLDLITYIREVSGNLGDATEEGREFHDQLVLAVQAAFDFASVDLSSNVTIAANEAGRLADNLEAARGARIDALTNNVDFSDPRGRDAGSANAGRIIRDRGVPRQNRPGYKAPKASRGRGGGGGSSSQRDPLQRLIEEVALNEALLGVSEERAKVMRRLGVNADKYSDEAIDGVVQRIEAYEREKAALELIQEQQQSMSDTIQSSMTDAFMSIVDGTKSAKDAFKDMAREIIAELLRVLVVQQLIGSFNSKTGQGTGTVGAIMGGLKGAASGRSVQAGQPYMVGEHGREPFVPSQNGRILSTAQAKSAIAGGGGGNSVNQTINISTGVAQTVRAEIRIMMPQIVNAAKAAVSDEARRNPGFRSAF